MCIGCTKPRGLGTKAEKKCATFLEFGGLLLFILRSLLLVISMLLLICTGLQLILQGLLFILGCLVLT